LCAEVVNLADRKLNITSACLPPGQNPSGVASLFHHVRAPNAGRELNAFQPGFPFLLRTRFAYPYHAAPHYVQWVFVWNDFDNLSASQVESPSHSETVRRTVDDEARKSLFVSARVYNKTGPLVRFFPVESSGVGNWRGEHLRSPRLSISLAYWKRESLNHGHWSCCHSPQFPGHLARGLRAIEQKRRGQSGYFGRTC
jgi:hypothetical protein